MGHFGTVKHLRFAHSLLLSPIIFFALSESMVGPRADFWIFFAVVLACIFPASNGYNCYYDRDEGSIGGLETPPPVEEELLPTTMALEAIGIALALVFCGTVVAVGLVLYGVMSKLYSHPRVRLKARPWVSLLVVSVFQGPVIFLLSVFLLS